MEQRGAISFDRAIPAGAGYSGGVHGSNTPGAISRALANLTSQHSWLPRRLSSSAKPAPGTPDAHNKASQHQWETALALVEEQLNGCHHVFLDLGANIGVHARFLFEPGKYNDTKHPYPRVFDQIFGEDRNLSSTCAFEFEPNPRHAERHLKVQRAYASQGWRYVHVPMGVSNESATLSFYRNPSFRHSSANNDWSFSAHPIGAQREAPVLVPTINIGAFLLRVARRVLPSDQRGREPPRVLVKMDIESEEFRVLPPLLARPRRVLCHSVDAMTMEWHCASPKCKPRVKELLGQLDADKADGECRFKWLEGIDDESYVHDGKPLPAER